MKTLIKTSCIAGLLLVGATATVLAQMPGTPYMPISTTITLAKNTTYVLASIYDADYLPYTTPTAVAATGAKAADGIAESTVINVQGSISTTGVTVTIPATATGSGTLAAYSTTITVPVAMTEDGVSRNLTFSWAEQSYTSSTTSIAATLAAVGGTLNTKKQDVNGGIGNDYQGVALGTFSYPYNNAGNTTTFSVRNIAGIPDKMFEKYDNGNTLSYEHQFIYVPVVGEDGKIWLNNNLGADYANLSSSSFNPGMQAITRNDYHAYGSLFQWGRPADGHELISWSSSTVGTAQYGATSTNSDAPTHALFITEPNSPYDWRVTQDDALWATEASANNPCPSGFRVPTSNELTNLVSVAGISNSATAASSRLHFSVQGLRNFSNGTLYDVGDIGNVRTSSVTGAYAIYRTFSSTNTNILGYSRAHGFCIRCVKD